MALPDIRFTLSTNGLGRPLDGKDHYSSMVFYTAAYPSGFDGSNQIKKVFSLSDVEALGVVGDYSNETLASGGNYAMSVTSAADGDTVEFKVTSLGVTISLGVVTFATGDTTSTLATKARTAINALTSTHGFVAAGASANVLLTPPSGYGANLNGGSVLTAVVTGTITAPTTITQFSSGVNDPYIHIWYHAKRYFISQPNGVLWLGIFPTAGTLNFEEITTIQNYAEGQVRLFGIYQNTTNTAFATGQVTTLQGVADTNYNDHRPVDVIYTPNINGTALSALADLSALTAKNVLVDIGQDGDAEGNRLYVYLGKSIGTLGACLGTAAFAKVHENLGYVAKFNLAAKDTEFAVPAFSNGVKVRDQSTSLLNVLYAYHWTFIKKHIDYTGTYFVDAKTAIANTSDYCTLENNRTINKVIRNVRTSLMPQLNGPVYVDATSGKLTADTIGYLESLANAPVEQMEKDGELSGYKVIINPEQDVLSTGNLELTIQNVPVGVSRNINVNVGFVTKVS